MLNPMILNYTSSMQQLCTHAYIKKSDIIFMQKHIKRKKHHDHYIQKGSFINDRK